MGSVLKMVCKSNGKVYIHSSGADGEAAKKSLLAELKAGGFASSELQDDFDRLRRAGFFIEVARSGVPNSQLAAEKAAIVANCAAANPACGYNIAVEKPKPKPKPKAKKKKNAGAVKK